MRDFTMVCGVRNQIAAAFFGLSASCFIGLAPIGYGLEAPTRSFNQVPKSLVTISDGLPVHVESPKFAIKPLAGWEVLRDIPHVTLALKEPSPAKPVVGRVTYRRNLTVVTLSDAVPMDEFEAKEFKARILDSIKRDTGSSNPHVDENHQFVAYDETKTGLVIYSNFTLGEANLGQIHFIVANEDHTYWLTYTDLADELQKEAVFTAAWSMLSSIQVPGNAPLRFASIVKVGIAVASLVSLWILILGIRFLYSRRLLASEMSEETAVYDESDDGEDHYVSSADKNQLLPTGTMDPNLI